MLRADVLLAVCALVACAPATQSAGKLARPDGAPAGRVTELSGRPFAVRVSPNGTVLVTQQDDNMVARFPLGAQKPDAMILVGRDPGDVVFNRDGSRAYVSAFVGGGLHVIDVAAGRQIAAIRIANNAYRLAMLPDDSRLFVTSTNGKLYAVDPAEPRIVDSVYLGGALQGLALAPTGKTLLLTSTNGIVWKLDAATLRVITSVKIPGNLQDVAINRAETEVYVANEKLGVDILDAATLDRKERLAIAGFETFGLALTPDGADLYLTSPTGIAKVMDVKSRTILFTLNLQGTPRRVAFDATGRTALIANEANWVDVIK